MFKNIYLLFKRELKVYFVSPIAYVIGFVFLFISGYLFVSWIGGSRQPNADAAGVLRNFLILILFCCPVLTIKLFSEEKLRGTIELLLTSPVSIMELVLGKYLAALVLYGIILSMTGLYIFLIDYYSVIGPDYGVVFTGYLGLFLLGGSIIGIGVFTSALTKSQVIAAISGFGVSLFFLLIHAFSEGGTSWLSGVMRELSLLSHYLDFDKGIIDLKDTLYYILWIISMLLLANRAIEMHYWK